MTTLTAWVLLGYLGHNNFSAIMIKTSRIFKVIQCSKGLTLIDLSIALVVLGLIMVPLAQVAKNRDATVRYGNTNKNISDIQAALDKYYFEYDRFPCPADLTIAQGNANYGKAVDTNPGAPSPCQGTAVAMPGNQIMVGGVPFQDLKLPAGVALDGWQNKLTYAVSRELTRTDQEFNRTTGGVITVMDLDQVDLDPLDGVSNFSCTNTPTLVTNRAHWVVISHGPEGIGAYTTGGILNQVCPDAANNTMEAENCNYASGDRVFQDDNCTYSRVADISYYDDVLNYKDEVPAKIWSNSAEDGRNMFSDIDFIGINTEDPTAQLDVTGNVLVSTHPNNIDLDPTNDVADKTGLAITQTLCDENGENCFEPELIAGDNPVMRCDGTSNSTVMSGIGNSSALCDVEFGINFVTGSCPDGDYMSGIDSTDGSPICVTP